MSAVGASVTAASVPGVAAAPPPPSDAALIAACEEFLANEAESDRIWLPHYQGGGDGAPSEAEEARLIVLSRRFGELEDEIAAARATTLAGLQAKARACRVKVTFDLDGEVMDADAIMAVSLFDDLLGEARA